MKLLQMLWTFLAYGAIGLCAGWIVMAAYSRLQKWQVRRHMRDGRTIFFEPYQLDEAETRDDKLG